ncbi:hypothetical protein OAT67_02985 [Bacteriovoracaceae bacterium]|nr:hypothetical protein [Bacteriovoracaceae bacterium]|tara:strand:+ start:37470 stop:38177 length:708 start_codon:yes stop_codon:yes gene_type:complete
MSKYLVSKLLLLAVLLNSSCGDAFKKNDDAPKQPPTFSGWSAQMSAPKLIENEEFTLGREVCSSLLAKASKLRTYSSNDLVFNFNLKQKKCFQSTIDRIASATMKNKGDDDYEYTSNSRSNEIFFEKILTNKDSRLDSFCEVILDSSNKSVNNTKTIGLNRLQVTFYEAQKKYWVQITEFATGSDSKFYPYLVERIQVLTSYDAPNNDVIGFIPERAQSRPCSDKSTQYKLQIRN